ncbi:MAG: hemolysin-type calcium-binding repeat family protein [Rhizobium sp.]|nr:hemolysin-type calcium-binding repeat family protein [Rhizobium sp.]
MATTISKFNLFATFEVNASATRWILPASVMIYPESGAAINEDGTHADNQIQINGRAISSDTYGVDSGGASTDIFIGAQGAVVGNQAGIITSGANESITNAGTIDGRQIGIRSEGESVLIDNSGSIGGIEGVSLGSFGGDLINRETGIISGENAITTDTSGGQTVKTVNDGLLTGFYAYMGNGLGSDDIINHGTITGNVFLGNGDDVFKNIDGRFKDAVIGGSGSDTYFVSSRLIQITETWDDFGIDTVQSTVSNTLGKGLENLVLLKKGEFDGTGNGLANVLTGSTGKNTLDGKSGTDTLDGGKESDILTGGNDADVFVFRTGDGRDTITDFDGLADHIDLSGMNGIEDFNDLKLNHIVIGEDQITIVNGTDEIVLQGVTKSELTREHVDF